MCTYSRAKAEQRLLAVTTNVASRTHARPSYWRVSSLTLTRDRSMSTHVSPAVSLSNRRQRTRADLGPVPSERHVEVVTACLRRLWSLRFCLLPNLLPNLLFKLGHACLGLGLIAGVRLLIPTRLQLARH